MVNIFSDEETGDGPDREIVSVTEQGQATIPKRFRDVLGISAPGKAEFRKTESGDIIVTAPTSISEFRGSVQAGEVSATELLRAEREQDKRDEDEELEKFLDE